MTMTATMTGSDKQIEWATRIRQEFADSLSTKRTFRLSPESLEAVKTRANYYIDNETDSAWWISHFKGCASFINMIGFPLAYGMAINADGEIVIS